MTSEEMAVKITDVDARCKSIQHRVTDLERSQEALTKIATSVEVMAKEQQYQTKAIDGIKSDVSKLDTKVECLEQKPAKRWDGFWDKALWAVAAAVITFFLTRIGL